MSKKPPLLEYLQEQLVAYEKKYGELSNTDRRFILLGVEFDTDAFPEIMMNRSVGNYATQMAGLQLLEDMIHEDREKLKQKLSRARQSTEPKTIHSTPPPQETRSEVDNFLKSLRDKLKKIAEEHVSKDKMSEEDSKIDEVLKNVKNQFGFDGPHGFKGDFDFKTSGTDDDDDDD